MFLGISNFWHCFIRVFLLLGVSGAVVSADDLSNLSGVGDDAQIDALSFTNTQKWDSKYLSYTRKTARYLPIEWQRTFAIPAPPANSSPRTEAELAYLRKLIPNRGAHTEKIRDERKITHYRFGKHTYASLTDGKRFPNTSKLLLLAHNDLAVVVFTFKKRFNRVRPSILGGKTDRVIGTVIAIPNHPAYPSGHATESFTLAYLLQELDPKNAEIYRRDALSIAQNREIAGLHYPSDTEAGRVLARQIADALLANPKFKALLDAARTEW